MINLPPWALALIGTIIGATIFGVVYTAAAAFMMLFDDARPRLVT